MAKEYTYTLTENGKVLYKTVEANYVSRETVDQQVKEKTGRDPRLERATIECVIRVVKDPNTLRSSK